MRLAGETTVALGSEELRGILADPVRLTSHLPGVSDVAASGARWTFAQAVPLGLGDVHLRWDCEQLDGASLRATGTGETLVVLLEASFAVDARDAGSSVRWEAEVRLVGSASALARKVAGPLVRQQLDGLLREIGASGSA